MEPVYEVNCSSEGDDKLENLFAGSEHDCHVFLDAYIMAMITHTAYTYDEKTITADWVYLRSSLISQLSILLVIQRRPNGKMS
jgi:hypothetical protein